MSTMRHLDLTPPGGLVLAAVVLAGIQAAAAEKPAVQSGGLLEMASPVWVDVRD